MVETSMGGGQLFTARDFPVHGEVFSIPGPLALSASRYLQVTVTDRSAASLSSKRCPWGSLSALAENHQRDTKTYPVVTREEKERGEAERGKGGQIVGGGRN